MLTENDIVRLLSAHLKKSGYIITQSLLTTQQGIDIIAEDTKHILYIEAKGETSSKEHSKRYGNAFDGNQIKSHVSRAILASMKILHDKPAGPKTKVGIALPDTAGHRELVAKINIPLKTLGIKIFFVTENGVHEQ
ncbi:hypothetical protein L3C95_31775 [Chitinophaga filiformis]|uniref:hypothetical protein n=1 Tax=Chitinophaga filiformis TaxID=104663 RepID=UPI001F3E9B67|nr:hypothetical protein [Chitinophaga filiformis]MCF6407514.1 hypothetical protein [Chitinophaga filiformis]